MRMLATLQDPDAGSIYFDEVDLIKQKREIRQSLGYLPQDCGLPRYISARKLLMHFAILKGITVNRQAVVDDLLRKTNLWEKRKHAVCSFSGGMRQRFGVAVALLGNPKLLIVDEPTAGLDPDERVRLLSLLSELGEQSVIILSSHIVEDIAELCTSVAIIDKGRILLERTPQQSIAALKGRIWRKIIDKHTMGDYGQRHHVISKKLVGGRSKIHVFADGIPGHGFIPVDPTLEDVYFSVIAGFYPTSTLKDTLL